MLFSLSRVSTLLFHANWTVRNIEIDGTEGKVPFSGEGDGSPKYRNPNFSPFQISVRGAVK